MIDEEIAMQIYRLFDDIEIDLDNRIRNKLEVCNRLRHDIPDELFYELQKLYHERDFLIYIRGRVTAVLRWLLLH